METKNIKTTFALGVFIAFSSVASNNISAQITEVDTVNTAGIEVVTVTASKKEQKLSDIAASLSVLDEKLLTTISHQHINQAIAQVSGAWVSRGNGQEHLTAIRSPVLTGAGACGAFFMAADGISLRAAGLCNTNQLFDANTEQARQIEILKGPSGTLYGSNALHGVINILSPDLFQTQQNKLQVEAGANEFYRTKINAMTSIDAQSKIGVFANLTSENGYQAQSGYDQQKVSVIYQSQGKTWDNKTVIAFTNLNQDTAGFVQGFEIYKDSQARRENPNPEAFRNAKSLSAYTKFSTNSAQGNVSLTPYFRSNEMAFLQHFLPWKALEENAHNSLGLQAQYNLESKHVEWIFGADIDYTQGELQETQAQAFSASIPAGDHYDYDVDARTIAAYGQAKWAVDQLELEVGARVENVNYDYDNQLSTGSACIADVTLCRFTRPASQSVDFTFVSPSLNLSYVVNASNRAYLKLNQGFRAPQATELFRLQNNQQTAALDNERINAIELGWQWVSDATSVRAAMYKQEKKDVIFQDSDRQNVIGGETSHNGLEIEFLTKISPNVDFAFNYAYAEHHYESDFTFSRVSIEGNDIDTAPKHLANARINWKINDKISAHLLASHLSRYYLNPENTAEYDGHTLVDLVLQYTLLDDLEIQASIYNVLDEDYAERADFGFGNYRYFVGQPRRVFVSATWRW